MQLEQQADSSGAGAGRGDRVVVANFNNWKKVCPATAGVWARVLQLVTVAGLWLVRMLPYAGPEEALVTHLEQRGVARYRVAVTEMLPAATHLLQKRDQVPRLCGTLMASAGC